MQYVAGTLPASAPQAGSATFCANPWADAGLSRRCPGYFSAKGRFFKNFSGKTEEFTV